MLAQVNSTQRMIKSGSLRALFSGINLSEKSDLQVGLLRKYGINYTSLPVSYPFDRYLEMLEWLRLNLYPVLSKEAGYEQLGRAITRGFFQTPMGQVLKTSLGVIGPQRSVRYFFRVAGGALPFGEFKVIQEQPGYLCTILNNVPGSPDVMRGMALESMEVARIKEPSVEYRKINPDDTQFIARWQS